MERLTVQRHWTRLSDDQEDLTEKSKLVRFIAICTPFSNDTHSVIGIPNASARLQILQTLLSSTPHSLSPKEIEDTAFRTHGYVGADLAALCREAGLVALNAYLCDDASMRKRPDLLKISILHIDAAITKIRPSAMREV